MNSRLAVGTGLLLVLVIALPAAALPDISGMTTDSRTGTAWVTVTEINSTNDLPQLMAITYGTGYIYQLPVQKISEDATTGFVTITVARDDNGGPEVIVLSNKVSGDSLYRVGSIQVADESEALLTNNYSFAAVPAAENYYSDTVLEGKQHEWVDLNWNDSEKDLGLVVYAPDAIFGPYSDSSDGRKDGRIFLDIASRLNVTAGTWFFRVQNNNPEYTPYTLNTYSA